MHLRPSERNFATGKPNTNYELTESGAAVASQVEEGLLNNAFSSIAKVSKHDEVVTKKNKEKYLSFTKSPAYLMYLETKEYRIDLIWRIFRVMPFSQLDMILADVKEVKEIAKSENDASCQELAQKIEVEVRNLISAKRESEKARKK